MVPIPSDSIEKMYKETGPKEGYAAHKVLEQKMGFAYRTLLGELMYSYITCRPDIGYSVTTLSKFSTAPAEYHYKLLRMVAMYLLKTADWEIRFKRTKPLPLTETDYETDLFVLLLIIFQLTSLLNKLSMLILIQVNLLVLLMLHMQMTFEKGDLLLE